jgi:hypothetical protein
MARAGFFMSGASLYGGAVVGTIGWAERLLENPARLL